LDHVCLLTTEHRGQGIDWRGSQVTKSNAHSSISEKKGGPQGVGLCNRWQLNGHRGELRGVDMSGKSPATHTCERCSSTCFSRSVSSRQRPADGRITGGAATAGEAAEASMDICDRTLGEDLVPADDMSRPQRFQPTANKVRASVLGD